MIPRKRLQVLLYVLRIIYVLGDGDPHRLHQHRHLPDDNDNNNNASNNNLIITNNPNLDRHRIHERVTSIEENDDDDDDDDDDEKFINVTLRDNAIFSTNKEDQRLYDEMKKEEEKYDDVSNSISNVINEIGKNDDDDETPPIVTTTTPPPPTPPIVVESLNVTRIEPTALNVSWIVSGNNDNVTVYIVDLYVNDEFKKNYTVIGYLYLYMRDLESCTKYKIEVGVKQKNKHAVTDIVIIMDNDDRNDKQSISATTLSGRPSEPKDLRVMPMKTINSRSALRITWRPPTTAHRCVAFYQVTLDNVHEKRDMREFNTTSTNLTFENVYACRIYAVTVFTYSANKEPGAFARNESIVSSPDVTAPPILDVTVPPKLTKDSISLSWLLPSTTNNCLLKSIESECRYNASLGNGYELKSNNTTVLLNGDVNPLNVSVTIGGLSPYTHYVCRARTIVRDLPYDEAASPWSTNHTYVTSEDVPSQPLNFRLTNKEITKRTFKWDEPYYRPGKILGYRIRFRWWPNYNVPDGCPVNRSKIYDTIDGTLTEYSITIEPDFSESNFQADIAAKTDAGWSEEATVEDSIMQLGAPDKVTCLRYEIRASVNDSNVLDTMLYWKLPCVSKGWLYAFNLSFTGKRDNYPEHEYEDDLVLPDKYDSDQIFEYNFGELRPLYVYTFEVSAILFGSVDSGDVNNITIVYPSGIPPQPKDDYIKSITLNPQKSPRSTTKAFVLLPVFPQEVGEIKHYAIIVSSMPFVNKSARFEVNELTKKWPDVASWEESKEMEFKVPYQATVSFWKPSADRIADYGDMKAIKFEIGDDPMCPQVSANTKDRVYCNGPLNPDSWYLVRMRAFTSSGYADSAAFTIKTNAELNVGLVLGVIFGILFIGTSTALVLMIKRCSVRLLIQRILQSSITESPVPNPMQRRKFVKHCQQLADNPAKLANEFQLLQTLSIDLQMPSNHAYLQGNRKKNRYTDILPYDFSRVKLDIIDNDPCSDYINASYVKGYSGDNEYIACQGPKEETTYDFWRMIDQYDVKIILMLTQFVERGKEKCHQYFPTARETFTYETFSIKCTSELDYRNYTQRTLILEKDEVKRTITHWHFKNWPDHDVPDDFDAMLHFVQMFRKQLNSVKGLAVVHCSAGIGRTGTLMAIDILLQSLKDCRKIDVFGTVYRLRSHRLNMVQRESQYAYIYNCIRQVLKNPYFSKTYKPPPMDPIYAKANKTHNDKSDSSTDLVESFDTLKKNSLSTSMDSLQPLCQSSPQVTPRIQMNVLFSGLRSARSTSAIETRSNHNRLGKYNSENYIACETRDSFLINSAEEDGRSSTSTIYENIEPMYESSGASYIPLTNDIDEKDTSL